MNLSIEKLREDQQLMMLGGLVVAVLLLTASFLQTRAENRPSVQGTSQLEAEIQAMQRDIREMSKMPSLEAVDTYWLSLFDTAAQSGLELKTARVPDDQRYRGPLQSRTGILEGSTSVVLSTLYELHQDMPLFLYSIKIQGQLAEVTLSVVGV